MLWKIVGALLIWLAGSWAIKVLRAVPHVVQNPEPLVQVLTLNQTGVVLSVRPFCHHDHYWQVYFDANQAIVEVLRLEQPA